MYFGSKIYTLPLYYDDDLCGITKRVRDPCVMRYRDFKHCEYPVCAQEFSERTCSSLDPITDKYYFGERHR